MNASTWSVVNRFNDIKIASFVCEKDAHAHAIALNRLAAARNLDNPWFVSNY